MISKNTFKFLTELEQNNNKPWFDIHRPAYETAKEDVLEFCATMIKELGKRDAGIAMLEPKQCIFRINRDVRFSKNKAPYKNNMGIYFNAQGKKSDTAGYYIHMQPGASFVAAGMWQPPAPLLAKLRQEIDYNFTDWKKIMNAASFKKNTDGLRTDDKLVRPPKGYDEENPAVDFLKHKSFVASVGLADAKFTGKDAVKNVMDFCKAAEPLVMFLNRGLDG
jgi:uncharacterized protein (TIGR02453 family)